MGYYRAGFTDITGVDIVLQKRYPFKFIQADAMTFLTEGFDIIHASPPCQSYSRLKGLATSCRPKLIERLRCGLLAQEIPFIIENVQGADLLNPLKLCGSSFGLNVWRHRLFEIHGFYMLGPACNHVLVPCPIDVTGTGGPMKGIRKSLGGGKSRKPATMARANEAMGINWMIRRELNEAIPPAYTEWIGRQIIAHKAGGQCK